MKRRRSKLLPVILILGLLLIAAVGAAAYYFILRPTSSTVPMVLIHSPRDGTRLEVGEDLILHASARDDRKVQRVEFWVDGTLLHSESSSIAGGTSPFPLLAAWRPAATGLHTLTVRAFNAQGGRAQASVDVEVATTADRDGDGVPDSTDSCPDQAGSSAAYGCPDRDGDSIADTQDACPDQAGLPANNGCPAPSVSDRDGDGIADTADACVDQPGSLHTDGCPDADADAVADNADACPSEPGSPERSGCPTPGDRDGDGVADSADACPGESGVASTAGCPDTDGDGVRDSEDACPTEAGSAALGGCPDRDDDGVRDSEDVCPDVPGPATNGGCPSSGASDRDGDGLADDADRCPDEPGTVELGGCPPPMGGADEDSDGLPDDTEVADDTGPDLGLFFQAYFGDFRNVEVQALELVTSHDYDRVHCYVSLAERPSERYGPFNTLGATYWDIGAELGGENSARLLVPESVPLGVNVECGGENVYFGPEGGEGTYYDMGMYGARHPSSVWDGRVIETDSSVGGDEGHWFRLKYRICSPSCDQTALQAPMLHLFRDVGGDTRLVWYYAGSRADITGFKVYINGSSIGYIGPDRYSLSVAAHAPPCGETYAYQLTAYHFDPGGLVGESPPSNEAYWTAPECPHRVRVTFETIRTGGDWGETDEWEANGGFTGPIYGSFFANDQRLAFDMANYWWDFYIPVAEGEMLLTGMVYQVDELFTLPSEPDLVSCHGTQCPPYSVPDVNYVDVELGPHDDLAFGGSIYDYDIWSRNDKRFDGRLVLPADLIYPGFHDEFRLNDRNITLTVRVEVLAD